MIEKEKHPEISIESVKKGEVDTLLHFSKRTFIEAFGHHNTKSDMDQYLQQSFTLAAFLKQFETPGTYFYFARIKKEIVGYLKLNIDDAQNEPLGSSALEIERIYVDGNQQGLGLGKRLLDFSFQQARLWEKRIVWLGVWDQNSGAIRFYERHGFELFDQHEFMLGSDRQTDLLMKSEVERP